MYCVLLHEEQGEEARAGGGAWRNRRSSPLTVEYECPQLSLLLIAASDLETDKIEPWGSYGVRALDRTGIFAASVESRKFIYFKCYLC